MASANKQLYQMRILNAIAMKTTFSVHWGASRVLNFNKQKQPCFQLCLARLPLTISTLFALFDLHSIPLVYIYLRYLIFTLYH